MELTCCELTLQEELAYREANAPKRS